MMHQLKKGMAVVSTEMMLQLTKGGRYDQDVNVVGLVGGFVDYYCNSPTQGNVNGACPMIACVIQSLDWSRRTAVHVEFDSDVLERSPPCKLQLCQPSRNA
jgi:hypothetical protein